MEEFDLSPSRDTRIGAARDALRADGCLVLRNALPVASVVRLRHELADAYSAVSGGAWDWRRLRRAARGEDLLGMRRALFACASNAALFRQQRLTAFLSGLLGAEPYLHPRRWLRLNEPGNGVGKWAVPHHQDYRFVHGTPDVLTVWTPLHACERGGILVERRSHRDGLRPLGERGADNHLPPALEVAEENVDEPRCDLGDVVVFHSLTVHATAPNPDRFNRISVDARFQRVDDPIAVDQLAPAIAPQDGMPISAPGVPAEHPAVWSGDPLAEPPTTMPRVEPGGFHVTRPIATPRLAAVG